MNRDNAFIEGITPDVLVALGQRGFFEVLDDQMCPKDPRSARTLCQGTQEQSTNALIHCGFDNEAIADVLAVLAAGGGHCDCEVLYNVAEESRLKVEFWTAVAAQRRPLHDHGVSAGKLVRLWRFIEKDDVGFPESQNWEDLWAHPVDDGQLLIDSVPFFAKGIARRDKVTAVVSDEGFLALDEITERGGHGTFRIWLTEYLIRGRNDVIPDLGRIGAIAEETLDRLIAIDAAPEHESAIWAYLEEGARRSRWEIQVGYSPD